QAAHLRRVGIASCDCQYQLFFSSRRRHTRSKRDWSSDVCSSDLKSSFNVSTRFFDNENAVAEANLTTPASIKSKIPSCNTSENTSISLNGESFIPLKTAFATEPTPDCNGANDFGKRPASTSPSKNFNRLFAISCVSSFGSNNGEGMSGCSEMTIPFTLSGSTLIPISP